MYNIVCIDEIQSKISNHAHLKSMTELLNEPAKSFFYSLNTVK